MGLGRDKFTVTKAGEWIADSASAHVGGSPMAVNQSGKLTLAKYAQLASAKSDGTSTSFVGVAYNSNTVDQKTYKGQATFVLGSAILTLSKMLPNTNNSVLNVQGTAGQEGDDFPYDTSLTWNEGDLMFIGQDGKWTNANPASGKPCYGTVLEVGTSSITVVFYGSPSAIY